MGEDRVVGTENLQLDLVVRKGNENDIIIFDVAVPFENSLEAFDDARKLKVEKYKDLTDELSTNRKRGHCG